MTLREFLLTHKIVGITNKQESGLGMIISAKFFDKNKRGATKVKVDYCTLPVNSYSVEFLESCIDDIITYIEKQLK